MSVFGRTLATWIAAPVLVLLLSGWCLAHAGLRVNISRSIPRGLYWFSERTAVRGDYVAFCPPPQPLFLQARERGYIDHGTCRGGYQVLFKVLVGVAGDVVAVDADGVRINGQLLSDSAPLRADRSGRALPQLSGLRELLPPDRVLLMSQACPSGFDGRYFGSMPRSTIRGGVRPLLTWE